MLIFLPKKFNPKVLAIEELTNLSTLTLDQLLGILIAYEMKISKRKSAAKVSSFKVEKKWNDDHDDSCYELDE